MPIDKRWEQLGPSDWTAFAGAWLAAIREPPSEPESDVSQAVVMMNFTATPAQQWQFILAAVAQAQSDDELGHVAAGPIEHLLGRHGDEYIDAVERQATADAKFGRALTGVWKHLMTDAVWTRVEAVQARVADPLQMSEGSASKT